MPIPFNDGDADNLATSSKSMARLLRSQSGARSSAGDTARTDLSGGYLPVLNDLCTTEYEDRARLAGKFEDLAVKIIEATRRAGEERERIAEVRRVEEFNRQITETSSGLDYTGLLPVRESYPVAPTPIRAAFQARIRSRSSRRGQGAKTSANPGRLRTSSDDSAALNAAVGEEHSRLVGALARYKESCAWAPIESMTAFHAVTVYNDENHLDVAWLRRIADAFERAGSGTLPTSLLDLVATVAPPVPLHDLAEYLQSLSEEDLLLLAVVGAPWLGLTAVEGWWDGLSEADRAALIAGAPALIGNLNGIPISARVAANQTRAAELAKMPGISAQEEAYWNDIANGARTAVLMMPEFAAVIEMIGTITPETKHAITYVPGTTATIDGFYNGSHQQVSNSLVDASEGGAVAFVYVNGPWIDWFGPRANTNAVFLDKLSRGLQTFQTQVVDRDPTLGQAQIALIGHSAAATVVTQAAAHGGRTHTVVSLAGSYVSSPKAMSPDIKYHHFQYDNDPTSHITPVSDFLVAGPGLQTPGHLPGDSNQVGFTQHIFDSDGMESVEAHSAIAQDSEQNQDLLDELARSVGVVSEEEQGK